MLFIVYVFANISAQEPEIFVRNIWKQQLIRFENKITDADVSSHLWFVQTEMVMGHCINAAVRFSPQSQIVQQLMRWQHSSIVPITLRTPIEQKREIHLRSRFWNVFLMRSEWFPLKKSHSSSKCPNYRGPRGLPILVREYMSSTV